MIICGHFHDYWWESYDYLCRVWGLYVGLLMIIFGEAGEILIIFCGICGHFMLISGEAGAMLIICGILKRV